VTSALIGASRVAQIDDSVAALDNLSLSGNELRAIEQALAVAERPTSGAGVSR
jgi:aryl-alcohol dehydrogenase-like predicted oxidoreductase